MQVADTAERASTATLGAKETRKVAMVEDAGFLMMLSSNLYSNQLLAAIREPLCNAWDAHIEAGAKDIPIQVRITSDLDLIIEDSGLGIPDDKIEQIYGTYGASTKKNDSKTTGGFGLGSKSPWAIVESFRVTSEHDGVKTVYNMSKACVENDGKPGITPVLSVPTTRSGLTVNFRITEEQVEEVATYIKAIALHGEMNVEFSFMGQGPYKLPVLGMSEIPGSYNINKDLWYRKYMGNHRIFIRYGAVIYPALQTPATKKAYELVTDFMDLIRVNCIVLQAAPDILALTPSREALSSQKMTEDGITDLCVDLVQTLEQSILDQIPTSVANLIAKLETPGDHTGTLEKRGSTWDLIRPLSVNYYISSNLGRPIKEKYHTAVKHAENRGFKAKHVFKEKHVTKQYHRMRRKGLNSHWSELRPHSNSFIKHNILRPMAKVIFANKTIMNTKSLHISSKPGYSRRLYEKNFLQGQHYYNNQAIENNYNSLKDMIDTPVVFIAPRKQGLTDTIDNCPLIRDSKTVWVYRMTAPEKKNLDAIKTAFTNAGYEVIDLNTAYPWDTVDERSRREQANKAAAKAFNDNHGIQTRKPKSVNCMASLSNFYDEKTNQPTVSGGRLGDIKDIKYETNTPLFYVTSSDFNYSGLVGEFVYYADLTTDEKGHGVLVRNGIELKMAQHRGAVHCNTYFASKFKEAVFSNEYKRYVTKQRRKGVSDDHYICSADLKTCRTIGIDLKGYDKLIYTPKLERIKSIVGSLTASSIARRTPMTPEEMDYFTDVIKKFKLVELPFITKLGLIKNDPIISRLGYHNIVDWLNQYPERKTALKSLVLSALKKRK